MSIWLVQRRGGAGRPASTFMCQHNTSGRTCVSSAVLGSMRGTCGARGQWVLLCGRQA